jgi:hypothetical protein
MPNRNEFSIKIQDATNEEFRKKLDAQRAQLVFAFGITESNAVCLCVSRMIDVENLKIILDNIIQLYGGVKE